MLQRNRSGAIWVAVYLNRRCSVNYTSERLHRLNLLTRKDTSPTRQADEGTLQKAGGALKANSKQQAALGAQPHAASPAVQGRNPSQMAHDRPVHAALFLKSSKTYSDGKPRNTGLMDLLIVLVGSANQAGEPFRENKRERRWDGLLFVYHSIGNTWYLSRKYALLKSNSIHL